MPTDNRDTGLGSCSSAFRLWLQTVFERMRPDRLGALMEFIGVVQEAWLTGYEQGREDLARERNTDAV